jgi:hypothetical protein
VTPVTAEEAFEREALLEDILFPSSEALGSPVGEDDRPFPVLMAERPVAVIATDRIPDANVKV